MTSSQELKSITDDELLRRLAELVQKSRRIESELVAHIGEVDERKLYARQACTSMFTYCTEVLHLSEGEAYLRIGVARAARKFPLVLEMLADGRLHLSGAAKLAPHLNDENVETVLARAAHRTKRQTEELVAELAPRPDVPSVVRKLPVPPAPPTVQLRPDAVKNEMPVRPAPPPVTVAAVQPLAPARYKVQFTACGELRNKLERLQTLMNADLAEVIEASVTEKLERLEARRMAETSAPRKTVEDSDTSAGARYIPAAVKRVVRARDGDQCTFVDREGRRCTERYYLEFHHQRPFARGGDRSPENIRLTCRTHNAYFAELDFGKDLMARRRGNTDRVSEPAPYYGIAVRNSPQVTSAIRAG